MRALRALWLPPWRRAPRRAWSSPSLFLGVLVAAFVLGLAGGSRPMFAASAGTASLHRDLEESCRYSVGLRIDREVVVLPDDEEQIEPGLAAAPNLDRATAALDRAVGERLVVDPVVVTLFGGSQKMFMPDQPDRQQLVQLVERDGFERHIHVLRSAEGEIDGAWLPDVVADDLGAGPGDEVSVNIGPRTLPVRVAGVFRDLRADRDDYWCSMGAYFDPPSAAAAAPPPVVLFDEGVLRGLVTADGPQTEPVRWEYAPSTDGWDLSAARRTIPKLTAVGEQADNLAGRLGRTLGYGTTSVDVPRTVERAERAEASVQSVAGPVSIGTAGVALVMLLAAARSWLARRSQEITVLSLRGAGPAALSLKAMLELLPGLLLGVAAGLAAAVVVVQRVGPDPHITSSSARDATVFVAGAVLVTLVAVAAVVAAGVRRVGVDAGAIAAPRTTLPLWEPIVLGLAAAALYDLRSNRTAITEADVDGMLLVFPLLLLAAGAGLGARLALARRPLDWIARHSPAPVWLAARRLVASRIRAVLIVTGAAISIGIVVFAGALSDSVSATSYAKATLGPGSQQSLRLSINQASLDAAPLPGQSTVVIRTSESTLQRAGHDQADVLGVDPDTFADAAYWDDSFADRSLNSLLSELRPTSASAPLRAIAVGNLPVNMQLTLAGEDDDVPVAVEVVARARAFPGLGFHSDQPLVVVRRDELLARGVTKEAEVWVDDPSPAVRDRLVDEQGLQIVFSVLGASDVEGTPLQPQLWAVDYLQVVGLAAGLVTVAGLGLYFAANAKRRRLGSAFARRVGMRAGHGILATTLEVSFLLLSGLVAGVGLSWLTIWLVYDRLDPLPQAPPDPILRLDLQSVALSALGALLGVVVATLLVERRAGRASLPELLREAG